MINKHINTTIMHTKIIMMQVIATHTARIQTTKQIRLIQQIITHNKPAMQFQRIQNHPGGVQHKKHIIIIIAITTIVGNITIPKTKPKYKVPTTTINNNTVTIITIITIIISHTMHETQHVNNPHTLKNIGTIVVLTNMETRAGTLGRQ